MPANLLESGAASVQFAAAPLRTGGESPQLFQTTGLDSAGDRYVYDKARVCRTTHRLTFANVTAAVVAALDTLCADTAFGSKNQVTWHDHEAVAHTVRIIGKIDRAPTGPDRFRVSLTLEEDVAWALPVGSSLAGKTAAPVWVLKWTINDVVYYLADATVAVTPWGVTTKPWVTAWGIVQEGITNSLGEFRVTDFDVTFLVDAASNPNMETLATSYALEKTAASLYLYDLGAGTLREVFRGYARDVDLPDDTAVNIVFEDESSRLSAHVGTKVDRTTYPSADPDDVGKVIPIVLNNVVKLPALAIDAGIMTSLPAAISAVATSFDISDAIGLADGMTLVCDDEEMALTGVAGDLLTVTRGANATLAVTHQKGARIWQKKSEFVYVAADHAVDSISKVYGEVGGILLDVTAICTLYPAGNHPSHPGKAVVSVPGYITVQQAIDLAIADGIAVDKGTLAAALSGDVSKSGTVTLAGAIAKTGAAALGGNVADPAHGHTAGNSYTDASTNGPQYAEQAVSGSPIGVSTIAVFDNTAGGSRSSVTVTLSGSLTGDRKAIGILNDSNQVIRWVYVSDTYPNGPFSYTMTLTGSEAQYNRYAFRAETYQSGRYYTMISHLQSAQRSMQYTQNTSANAAGVNNGSLAVSDSIGVNNGNLAASDGIGIANTLATGMSGNVAKTGTVTLSGNSVANTLVGDRLLVNVTRSFATPAAAMQWLLTTYGGGLPLVQSGALPASYTLTGAITDYRELREWLNIMAFQLRSWFRVERGTARLIVRPDAYASGGTIAACRISEDGVKAHRRRKVEMTDVVNTINLLYDRDWAQSGGQAYRQCSKDTHEQSIIDNGVRERPELFQMDFVTAQAHADSLRDFTLAWHGPRRWLHTFQTYLDQVGLQFGDIRTLGFAGNAVGQIIEAGPAPGDVENIDTVQFTALV